MFTRIALVGASVATLAGAALAVAAPASADSTHWYSDAGYGHFASVGENLSACDQKADGYGIIVDWYVEENPSNSGAVHDGNGANNGCVVGNLSIAEGNHILYRVCIANGTTRVACTGYFRDTA